MAEFGESVIYLPPASTGKRKFDVRLMDGVWVGMKLLSGESIIGTADSCESQRREDGGATTESTGSTENRGSRTREQVEGSRSRDQVED